MSERPTVAARLYPEARLFPWRRRLGNGELTAARGGPAWRVQPEFTGMLRIKRRLGVGVEGVD